MECHLVAKSLLIRIPNQLLKCDHRFELDDSGKLFSPHSNLLRARHLTLRHATQYGILCEAQLTVTTLFYSYFMLITSYLATCCEIILWLLVLKLFQFALVVVVFILKPNKICIYFEYRSWRYMFDVTFISTVICHCCQRTNKLKKIRNIMKACFILSFTTVRHES